MIADCIIPARYASRRLPGKPLALIADKPMIQWVYQQALKAQLVRNVIVATDNDQIKDAVLAFGGAVVMTDPDLPSGTDRVAKVAENSDAELIINVQGDEPFIPPVILDELIRSFDNPNVSLATPICKIKSKEELENPNVVKVCRNKEHFALYFSRAIIPYVRDEEIKLLNKNTFYKHIGIYAYRKEILQAVTKLPESALERAERLEQLRILENGYSIFTIETSYDSISIDTEEDLINANQIINQKN